MNIEISLRPHRTMGARIKTKGQALVQLIRSATYCEKFEFGEAFRRVVAIEATLVLGVHVSWVDWDEDQQEAQLGLRMVDPYEPGSIWSPSLYISLKGEVSSHANIPSLEDIQERLNQPF